MISQKTKYALKALLALANTEPDETMMIAAIAEQQQIPRKFLELILIDLRRLGYVYSRRGRTGGYGLARAPESITFGQVIRQIEGPLALLPCVSRSAYRRCVDCVSERNCALNRVLAEVREATAAVMDHRTLADALSSTSARRGQRRRTQARRWRRA